MVRVGLCGFESQVRQGLWGEWMTSALSTLNTTTEVRPLSKAPKPQLLPGAAALAAHCSGCVLTAVCVHLDGLNTEHKFQVWDTILGHTSFPSFLSLCINLQYECHPQKSSTNYMKTCSGPRFMLTDILPLFHISKLQSHKVTVYMLAWSRIMNFLSLLKAAQLPGWVDKSVRWLELQHVD